MSNYPDDVTDAMIDFHFGAHGDGVVVEEFDDDDWEEEYFNDWFNETGDFEPDCAI